MMTLIVNGMLSLLLVTCIIYCVRLEKRMRAFHATNIALGEAIVRLAQHTKEADEAVRRFREAASECETQISEPLASARTLSAKLEQQLEDAEMVMDKIVRIVGAANPAHASHTVASANPAPRRRLGDLPERSARSRFAGIG